MPKEIINYHGENKLYEKTKIDEFVTTLQQSIYNEQLRAETAEEQLQQNIDTEQSRAEAAENELHEKVDTEVRRAIAAERNENERALTAEKQLQQNIDTLRNTPIERLSEYLFSVTFNEVTEFNKSISPETIGACSSYVSDKKLYRNFDWQYSDLATYIVKCSTFRGIAITPGLTDKNIDIDKVLQLPYHIVDGVNDNGIMVAEHVLFNDWGWTGIDDGTPLFKVPYEILTKVKSIDTLEQDIGDLLSNLSTYSMLTDNDYLLQFIVTDGSKTKIIAPSVSNTSLYEVIDASSNAKLTNFRYVNKKQIERDDTDIQNRPTGVERFNLMPCALSDIKFTNCYTTKDFLSEFIGENGTTKNSTDEELIAAQEIAAEKYATRDRDNPETWHTMHSVVYGDSSILELYIQENFSKNNAKVLRVNGVVLDGNKTSAELNIKEINSLSATSTVMPTRVDKTNTDFVVNIDDSIIKPLSSKQSSQSNEGKWKNISEIPELILRDAVLEGNDLILNSPSSQAYVLGSIGLKFTHTETSKTKTLGFILAADEIGHLLGTPFNRIDGNGFDMLVHDNSIKRTGSNTPGLGHGGYGNYSVNVDDSWAWTEFQFNTETSHLCQVTYDVDGEHTFEVTYSPSYSVKYTYPDGKTKNGRKSAGSTLNLDSPLAKSKTRAGYKNCRPSVGLSGIEIKPASDFPIRLKDVKFKVTGGTATLSYNLEEDIEKTIIDVNGFKLIGTHDGDIKIKKDDKEFSLSSLFN